jgi:hypothetical protein
MHTVPKYAIFTPGRTGSHLITRNLVDYYDSKQFNDHEQNLTLGVVHSHYALWEPPDAEWIGIVSTRKNDFAAICSMHIARRTNDWFEYTNAPVQEFTIDYDDFVETFKHRVLFYQAFDPTKFLKTITICYENLIADSTYLFGQLDIVRETDFSVLDKSPYNYKKIIKNWQQALEWHTQLTESYRPTELELECWKSTAKKHF